MTKIIEKITKNDMRTHIDNAYKHIADSLPDNYVARVLEKLPNDASLTSPIIRNIKKRVTRYPSTRIAVLNALVEVANDYQKECNALKSNLTLDKK